MKKIGDEWSQGESHWLKIGDVARLSGLPVKTIRYYDDLGLLSPCVHRGSGGYRFFSPSVYNRLSFIKRSQHLGLTLREIQVILAVHAQGELPCGVAKDLLVEKLQVIQEQIESLNILKSELEGILSGWQEMPKHDRIAATICPNIQVDL